MLEEECQNSILYLSTTGTVPNPQKYKIAVFADNRYANLNILIIRKSLITVGYLTNRISYNLKYFFCDL